MNESSQDTTVIIQGNTPSITWRVVPDSGQVPSYIAADSQGTSKFVFKDDGTLWAYRADGNLHPCYFIGQEIFLKADQYQGSGEYLPTFQTEHLYGWSPPVRISTIVQGKTFYLGIYDWHGRSYIARYESRDDATPWTLIPT